MTQEFIVRRWEIHAVQEIRMWREILLLLLSASCFRDSEPVSNGEYSNLDFVSLPSFNTH